MILINLAGKSVVEQRRAVACRRLSRAVRSASSEEVQTVNLKAWREVLCGGCGKSTNVADACQWCGGQITRGLPNIHMRKRLDRLQKQTKKKMREMSRARSAK